MTIGANGTAFQIPRLVAFANNAPDILFTVGAKVPADVQRVRLRVALSDGSGVLKSWTGVCDSVEEGGQLFGNFLPAFLLTQDAVTGQFSLKFEIDEGCGYEELEATGSEQALIGSHQIYLTNFETARGTVGLFASHIIV